MPFVKLLGLFFMKLTRHGDLTTIRKLMLDHKLLNKLLSIKDDECFKDKYVFTKLVYLMNILVRNEKTIAA